MSDNEDEGAGIDMPPWLRLAIAITAGFLVGLMIASAAGAVLMFSVWMLL